MGIERLYTAAYAAGFAMATPEEPCGDIAAAPKAGISVEAQWQPGRAVLVHQRAADKTDWIAVFLNLLGRRPAPRRPALTAEA